MFKFFSSVTTGVASSSLIVLLFGLIGASITGDFYLFNPANWLPVFQVVVGVVSAGAFFISAFCNASAMEPKTVYKDMTPVGTQEELEYLRNEVHRLTSELYRYTPRMFP